MTHDSWGDDPLRRRRCRPTEPGGNPRRSKYERSVPGLEARIESKRAPANDATTRRRRQSAEKLHNGASAVKRKGCNQRSAKCENGSGSTATLATPGNEESVSRVANQRLHGAYLPCLPEPLLRENGESLRCLNRAAARPRWRATSQLSTTNAADGQQA